MPTWSADFLCRSDGDSSGGLRLVVLLTLAVIVVGCSTDSVPTAEFFADTYVEIVEAIENRPLEEASQIQEANITVMCESALMYRYELFNEIVEGYYVFVPYSELIAYVKDNYSEHAYLKTKQYFPTNNVDWDKMCNQAGIALWSR